MKSKKIYFMLIMSMFIVSLFACNKQKSNEVIVASKSYTENVILGEIMAQMIERHTDIKVVRKLHMGVSFVVYEAMKSKQIDMYPEYTGTLYQAHLKQTDKRSAEETFAFAKEEMAKLDIVVFPSFGFNNTFAIGMLEETATARNINTISDLKNHPDLIPGFDSEFMNRSDGGVAMIEYYGLQFDHDILDMDIGLKVFALAEKSIDFTDVYSTESKVYRYNIRILEDDKTFFPPYYAVPVVHKETLDAHPELESVLLKLKDTLDASEITQLNYKVEEEKLSEKQVASDFLDSKVL